MGETAGAVMQRDESARRGDEAYVVRPGESHIVRGDTHIVSTGEASSSHDATVGDTNPEELRAEIEQTRAEMSETIDAIQEKLAPENVKEQALEVVREASDQAKDAVRDATIGRAEEFLGGAEETVRGAGYSMIDAIKQNPIPAALMGIGLGWMVFNSRSQASRRRTSRTYFETYNEGYPDYQASGRMRARRSGYRDYWDADYPADSVSGAGNYRVRGTGRGDTGRGPGEMAGEVAGRVGETAGRAGETVGDLANRTGETVGGVASRVGDTAGDVAEEARYRAMQAQGTFQQQLIENPLAVGAIALGIGAAVGLAAPKTQAEDRLMGETRDRLMGQAQTAVSGARERVQQAVDQAGHAIQENAQDAIQQAGDRVESRVQQATRSAQQTVQQTGSAVGQAGSSTSAEEAARAAHQAAAAADRAGDAAHRAAQSQQGQGGRSTPPGTSGPMDRPTR